MIPLYEFNRIVDLVSSLPLEKKKAVGVEAVSDGLERIAIQVIGVDPYEIEQKSIDLGLIRSKNTRLSLTNNGNNLLKLQVVKHDDVILDDLTEAQQQFFVELIFSSPSLKIDLQNIFSNFRIHHSKKIWFYDYEKPNPDWNEELLNWLASCNFWNVVDNKLEVKQLYSKHVSKIKKRTPVTQQHLEEIIKIEKEVGEKAEQLTLSYEKERLKDDYPDMAMSVEQISKINVAAGYDIESFNGKGSTLTPDRMIEVKGTSGTAPYFYWSENEIETAKSLKEKYWVYLWIEVKSETEGTLYKKIQNPYEKLFKKSKKKPKAVLFRVDL